MLDALRVRDWDGARSALQRVTGRSLRPNTIRARRGGGERREQTPGPARRHVPGSSPPGRGVRFSNLGCQGSVRKGMHHRALIGTIAMLGFIALAGLFSALSFSLSSPSPAYAQANSPPQFPPGEITLEVEENMPPFESIGDPVDGHRLRRRLSALLAGKRGHVPLHHRHVQRPVAGRRPLDYETGSSYTVKVIATDPSPAQPPASP